MYPVNLVGVLVGLGVFVGYVVAVGIAVLVGICVGELAAVGIAVLVGICGSSILSSFPGPSSKGNVDESSIQDIHINEISSRGVSLLV